MAKRRIKLVYGGGSVGLMGALAEEVKSGGGEVVGVIPKFLMRREISDEPLSRLIITESMHDRKRRMFELVDGFIVLPGGLGTLDETFEIITWKQLGLHALPIVVIDIEGYWQPLRRLVEAAIHDDFAHPTACDLFSVVSSPEQTLAALEAARSPSPDVTSNRF